MSVPSDLSPRPNSPLLDYIRAHPFSTMALCNIIGDCTYLGYAFATPDGIVSVKKLCGALLAMTAHVLLLAYGDDQARVIAAEAGPMSRLFMVLRAKAQLAMKLVPERARPFIHDRAVGISFSMLAANGVAFVLDGLARLEGHFSIAMIDQTLMGVFIALGTGSFAIADFSRRQGMSDWMTKMASTILSAASVLNFVLAITTLNPFVFLSCAAFFLSNIAAFFTRLDKERRQHLQP